MLSMDTLLPALYDGSFRQEVATPSGRWKAASAGSRTGLPAPEGENAAHPAHAGLFAAGLYPAEFDAACTAAGVEPEYLADHALCSSVLPGTGRRISAVWNPDPHPAPQGAPLTVETDSICLKRCARPGGDPHPDGPCRLPGRGTDRRRSSAGNRPESRW